MFSINKVQHKSIIYYTVTIGNSITLSEEDEELLSLFEDADEPPSCFETSDELLSDFLLGLFSDDFPFPDSALFSEELPLSLPPMISSSPSSLCGTSESVFSDG